MVSRRSQCRVTLEAFPEVANLHAAPYKKSQSGDCSVHRPVAAQMHIRTRKGGVYVQRIVWCAAEPVLTEAGGFCLLHLASSMRNRFRSASSVLLLIPGIVILYVGFVLRVGCNIC